MTMYDVLAHSKKNVVMNDTWGHMFPEPGSKHEGYLIIACGEYGENIIIQSNFPTLNQHGSPQQFELEHSIFDRIKIESGEVLKVFCTLWFYKGSHNLWLEEEKVGRIIKIKVKKKKNFT